MSRTGPRFWLSPLSALLLSGCASYFNLEIGGEKVEQIRSVFLVVADGNPLGKQEQDAASLIRPDKVGNYLLFAQYDPEEGAPLRWKQESSDSRSKLLTLKQSQDTRTVTLSVDKSILEAYPNLTVIAVGHGSERWYAEVMDAGEVRLGPGVHLDVGAARFVRRQVP